jgi:prepilin-type N-terminal cleavage/methylation domain-containing protein
MARQRGFTMVEIFIVLALVAILASMATPYFRDMIGRYRLNAAARTTASAFSLARMLAVTRNTQVRVVFTEVDTHASDPSSAAAGLFRIEQWVPNARLPPANQNPVTGGQWELVDDVTVHRDANTLPPSVCQRVGSGAVNEYCVDLKERFSSVSVSAIDQLGQPSPLPPFVEYGPDGFIVNGRLDFAQGADPQTIRVGLSSKRGGDKMESRVIVIDRAGNVQVQHFNGNGVPPT